MSHSNSTINSINQANRSGSTRKSTMLFSKPRSRVYTVKPLKSSEASR